MKCPNCGCLESRVIDSRQNVDANNIRRRRECMACQKRFTTFEVVESVQTIVIKKNGSKQLFDRQKLLAGLLKACEKRPVNAETIAAEIEAELSERIEYFTDNNLLLEAQRIEQRTKYDLEMLREIGFCSGVENYSRVLAGREPGSTPYTLLDYFPKDFLLFVDESHVTLPQVNGMSGGDTARHIVFSLRFSSATIRFVVRGSSPRSTHSTEA